MNAKLIAIAAALAIAHFAVATNKTPQPDTSSSAVDIATISLTKPQAKAAGMADIVENFEKIDANNDGVITRNEMRAYLLATRRHVPMT